MSGRCDAPPIGKGLEYRWAYRVSSRLAYLIHKDFGRGDRGRVTYHNGGDLT